MMDAVPEILSVRQQDRLLQEVLRERFNTILPASLSEADIDMWLILCQEDDLDPVFKTMIPMNTWTPILQMLVFFDWRGEQGVERINLSMTDTGALYERPWDGSHHEEQWALLTSIIRERDPKTIGINIGRVNWASGGLTYNLYNQLIEAIPPQYVERLVSAEVACTHWLMTLSERELEIYPHIVRIAHHFIRRCFSSSAITPGITTTEDLEWTYWQMCNDHGLEMAFKPYFTVIRDDTRKKNHSASDNVIRRGDVIHCDVGFRYLRLCTDHQELAYVLDEGECDAPAGLRKLLLESNRLQNVFLQSFQQGLTGNQLLQKILAGAVEADIPSPKVYSHSLGIYLHEPGPLIGLPWEQSLCPGRGDIALDYNSCFTMELSVADNVPEWDNQLVRLGTEQNVKFTKNGCVPMDGVQTRFHLI